MHSQRDTPLYSAVFLTQLPKPWLVKALIEAGADVEKKGYDMSSGVPQEKESPSDMAKKTLAENPNLATENPPLAACCRLILEKLEQRLITPISFFRSGRYNVPIGEPTVGSSPGNPSFFKR